MKKGVIVFVALLFFSLVGFVDAQQYYDDYSDVLLVCNANSSVSQDICSYFIQQRTGLEFNSSHTVNLTNVSTAETISDSEFEKIYTQVNNWLGNNSNQEINYIVTTSGVPLRTSDRSVDSKLMARFGATANYYGKEDIFTREEYGGYLITRLTGYDSSDAKRLIDNSDNADLTGKFLINCYGGYGDYNCLSANSTISSEGYSTVYNNTGFVKNMNNLSGYVSWGSNAFGIGYGGVNANSSAWNLSFVAGALAETYVSTSARTFSTYPWSSGQSLISDLVHYNVTGVKGYVYEPYTLALANVNILYGRYLEGYNLADSYYMASSQRDWMDVVIGDPKTHAVQNSLSPSITLNNRLNGERMNAGSIINFTIQSSAFSNLSSVWYSTNDSVNVSFVSEDYEINTTGWANGNYNVTVYANDSIGNLGNKMYSFEINTTVGEVPTYYTFDGNLTTDLASLADRTNVSNLILENSIAGKIKFLTNVNISGAYLDGNIVLRNDYVSLNTTSLPSMNVSANITFYNLNLSSYDSSFLKIMKDGQVCTDCYNFTPLTSSTVTFNVSSFSSYYISGQYLTGCANITVPGTYYFLNNVSTTSDTCVTISNANITLDGQGHLITRPSYAVYSSGIYGNGGYGGNLTIRNISITQFYTNIQFDAYYTNNPYDDFLMEYVNASFSDYGYGGVMLDNTTKSLRVYNSHFDNNPATGFSVFTRNGFNFNWTVQMENVTMNNNGMEGLSIRGIPRAEIYNLSTSYNGEEGAYLDIIDSTLENIISEHNDVDGIWFSDGVNVTLKNATVKFNGDDGLIGTLINSSLEDIYLEGNGPYGGFSPYSSSVNNKVINLHTINEVKSIDDTSGVSSINYFIYDNSYATLNFTNESFLDDLSVIGNLTFPGDINLSSNYIYVNSTALPELNGSANLTFYFSPNEFSIPYIVKDSVACADCVNFTSLTSDSVEFNVSSFSAYSLMENDTTKPSLTYISNSVTNQSINVSFNVSDNGRLNNCTLIVGNLSNSTSNFSNPSSLFVSGLSADRTYTATLSCYDYADNVNSTNISFTTDANPTTEEVSSGSGTYYKDLGNLESGFYDGSLSYGTYLRFNVSNESHRIGIANIDRTIQKVKFNVYSEKQEIVLGIGESKQIDLNSDGKNDVTLTLRSIDGKLTKVNILLNKIEEVKETQVSNPVVEKIAEKIQEIKEKGSSVWMIFVVLLILIISGLAVMWKKKWSRDYRFRLLINKIKYSSKS